MARRERAARALEGQFLRHVLRHILRHVYDIIRNVPVLRRVLHVPVLHVSPKGSVGGRMRVLGMASVAGR